MSSKLNVPRSARELDEAARALGFVLVRKSGRGHLVYARDGVDGYVVVSCSPRNASCASRRVAADCRRLIKVSKRLECSPEAIQKAMRS